MGIFCGLFGVAGLYFLIYWFTPFRISPDFISKVYNIKEKSLSLSESDRIILISGSNGLFGLGMKEIEEISGRKSTNLGVILGVSLDYQFYNAKKFLKSGDTVILALEYHQYNPQTNNTFNTALILTRDPEYFYTLPFTEKIKWTYGEPFTALIEKLFLSPDRLKEIQQKSNDVLNNHINSHGDFFAHTKASQTEEQAKTVLASGPIPIVKIASETNSEQSFELINEFAKWCRKNNISLLATFPSIVYYSDYESNEVEKALGFIVEKYRNLGIPTLGTPQEFIWNFEDFYDSGYHLNEEAKIRRTLILASYLMKHFPNPDESQKASP
jgi:hypothetical protein